MTFNKADYPLCAKILTNEKFLPESLSFENYQRSTIKTRKTIKDQTIDTIYNKHFI